MSDRRGLERVRWSRRRFLRASIGSSAALVTGSIAAGWLLQGDTTTPVAARLIALLPTRDSAAAVGRAYLRITPGEADTDRLVRALVQRMPGLATAGLATDPELRALLETRSRLDFTEGDTVRVRGWVLSRTEARACALAALWSDDGPSG